MNNQNKEVNNQQVTIEDLTINQEQATEVKGGSYTTVSGRITAVAADPS